MRTMGAEVRLSRQGLALFATPLTKQCGTGWLRSGDTHYIIGSVVGPHPVSDDGARFSVGDWTRSPGAVSGTDGRLPNEVVACVGGGSNSAGMFYPFVDDTGVELTGVEAGGRGGKPGDHASTLSLVNPEFCMAATVMSCRLRWSDLRRALDFGGTGLSRRGT